MSKNERIIGYLESNQIPLLIFFISLFTYITFAGTRLFLSDEGIILDQFYNLINGSLAIKAAKINVNNGIFMTIGNDLYGKFSYSLLISSLPTFYILKIMDSLYSAHFFILQLWAVSGGIIVFLARRILKKTHAKTWGLASYLLLMIPNLYLFRPIYFPKWGELISIELTNIIISSVLVLFVYLFLEKLFSRKIAIFASFFIIFATPISFYSITLKHHNLTLLLTLMSFYFFYRSYEKNDNKFIYLSYITAGLCIWTRFLDGSILLVSLLITDFLIFKRSIKYISTILVVILISLLPFFIFNYLIVGTPLTVIENLPVTSEPVKIITAKDYIVIEGNQKKDMQVNLMYDLGYKWEGRIRGHWYEIFGYSLFSRLMNTFGVFLVSPLLVSAIVFIVSAARRKIKLNPVDKLFASYAIILFSAYVILHIIFKISPLISIIQDTPVSLEYRYLIVLYIIYIYFALRIDMLRGILEENYRTIIKLYGIILFVFLLYFITYFPIDFIDTYYYISIAITLLLFLYTATYNPVKRRAANLSLHGKIMLFLIAVSLSLSSFFLIFYYWIVGITYLSPGQNYLIVPVLNYLFEWMYSTVI